MGRGRDVAAKFLGNWEGKLQTDAYVGYDQTGGPRLTHYGCWAHARRYYVDAVKVNPADAEAQNMVLRVDALFLVDREASRLGLTAAERQVFRAEQARTWLDEIRETARSLVTRKLPRSKLGEALTYTLKQWEKLARCVEDGEVELSKNLAENSMRPWALGRKNWLHVGSVQAAPGLRPSPRSSSPAGACAYPSSTTCSPSSPASPTAPSARLPKSPPPAGPPPASLRPCSDAYTCFLCMTSSAASAAVPEALGARSTVNAYTLSRRGPAHRGRR